MTTKTYWIDIETRGGLAILPRPRGGDWPVDEVRSWRDQGIDVVVSLLTTPEIDELGLADEANACAAAGLELIAVPVEDRGVPDSHEAFADAVTRLGDLMAGGKTVGVHCRAGIGRSAMLAAALLIAAGDSPAEAFERVRTARGVAVPDTPEQRAWIESFAQSHPVRAI
jgi:protein-tyrosine phosphatase